MILQFTGSATGMQWVLTEGNIASVWTPYDFYINGEFSHCGVDLFYLVKEEDWKIAHFGYTVTETCK